MTESSSPIFDGMISPLFPLSGIFRLSTNFQRKTARGISPVRHAIDFSIKWLVRCYHFSRHVWRFSSAPFREHKEKSGSSTSSPSSPMLAGSVKPPLLFPPRETVTPLFVFIRMTSSGSSPAPTTSNRQQMRYYPAVGIPIGRKVSSPDKSLYWSATVVMRKSFPSSFGSFLAMAMHMSTK